MNNKNISFIDSETLFINPRLLCNTQMNQLEKLLIAKLNTEKYENYIVFSNNFGVKVSEVKRALKHLVEIGLLTEFYVVKPREVIKLMNKYK